MDRRSVQARKRDAAADIDGITSSGKRIASLGNDHLEHELASCTERGARSCAISHLRVMQRDGQTLSHPSTFSRNAFRPTFAERVSAVLPAAGRGTQRRRRKARVEAGYELDTPAARTARRATLPLPLRGHLNLPKKKQDEGAGDWAKPNEQGRYSTAHRTGSQ